MKQKQLILLTGDNDFFGQTRKPWVSMDVNKMIREIEQQGLSVTKYSFHQVANRQERISKSIIFYTFSQKLNRRNYITDVVHYLLDDDNILIPSYDMLKCHENKGFQELYKKKIGLTSLKSYYFSSVDELSQYEIDFPIVLKTVDGSNGKGVFLAKDRAQLIKLIKKLERQDPLVLLDLVRRKYFRKKKSYKEYPDYSNRKDYWQYRNYILKEKNFILQEFVSGLNYDIRVLALFDKYYVMRRYNKKNDFRASGSKNFDLTYKPSPELLNYARSVYQKFDTPFLSMDICQHQGKYVLLEFQALHFGVNVVSKNSGYYSFENNDWKFIEHKASIEKNIAEGLVKYIKARHS